MICNIEKCKVLFDNVKFKYLIFKINFTFIANHHLHHKLAILYALFGPFGQ